MRKSLLLLNDISVVIVDPAREAWDHWKQAIKSDGFDLSVLPDRAHLMDWLEEHFPDILLINNRLPDAEGASLVAELKQILATKDLPIIQLSSSRDLRVTETAFEAGASDFLTKPFSLSELKARIRSHVSEHRLSQALEEANTQLDERVQERTQQLWESNEALKAANERLAIMDKLKSRFLLMISHEIRTPLNGIFGAVEMLDDFDCQMDGDLSEIYSESKQRIETLIEDSQLLARLESGPAPEQLEQIHISSLIEDCIKTLAVPVDLKIEAPDAIIESHLAESTLALLFSKLLDTAVRFQAQGVLKLKLNECDGYFQLDIAVPGAFVDPALQERFFEPFELGEHETSAGDLGLRPALAGALAKLLSGRIAVYNDDKNGYLIFSLQLPVIRKQKPKTVSAIRESVAF